MESGFWNRRNFCLWNRKSCVLESGVQLKESGIHYRLESRIQVLRTNTGIQYLESEIRNPQRGILTLGEIITIVKVCILVQ